MVKGVRSPGLSHETRMASTSSDEEVDELATSPAPARIPDVEDSSDEEQDRTVRQLVQRRRPLTADERVLAKAVQAGVASEELMLIKGVRSVLRNHKVAKLEAQGIQDLKDYVANETRQDPAHKALLVNTQFSAWRKNQGLPVVPISAASIYRYAHHVFVDAKANWKHEHRLSMLTLLEQLRTVANKGYESDFRTNAPWRKAFLDSIRDTPEARALETVDRDLDAESDHSDSEMDDALDSISSGDEAARKLAASSSGRVSRGASEAISNEAIVKQTRGRKRPGSRSESPNRNKRQKQQATPLRAPSPVPVQNATAITDDALSRAMDPRRSHSKSLSASVPLLSPRSSRLGQPVQPTSPSQWTNSPASSVQPLADAQATTPQKLQQSSGRIVIDLRMDSSDEDDSSTPPVNTTKHSEAKDPDTSNEIAEPSNAASPISVELAQTAQPTEAKKPRPPLFPRPPVQNSESTKQTSQLPMSDTPTTAKAIKNHSEGLEAASVVNDAARDDLVTSANDSTSTPVEPSIPAIAHPHTAATLIHKAVRAIKETIVATVTKSSVPASPSAGPTAGSEVASDKDANRERPNQTADASVPTVDVVMEGSMIVPTEPDKASSTQQTGLTEQESEQAQVVEEILDPFPSPGQSQASNRVLPSSTIRAEVSLDEVPAASRTEPSHQDPDTTLELPAGKICEATEEAVKPVEFLSTPTPALSGAANSAHVYFDQWDESFARLERAVLMTLVNEDYPNTTQKTENSVYLRGTTLNRQVSAFFGWQRNARRNERLQHVRQGHFAQLRSHHALQNSLGPVPATAATNQTQPQPTPTPAGKVGPATALPSPDASTQDAVRGHVATDPVRQTDPSQQPLTPSLWQSMSPAQQKATRSAMLQRLKPRYPDFLRDIRAPTLATGLGPVYLGGATPSEILGGTARDHRRVSNPSHSVGVPADPSAGQHNVQNGQQQPSPTCTSATVVGSTQSAQISTTSPINNVAHSVQQPSLQVQTPALQDNVAIAQPLLIPTQKIPNGTASARPTVTANASSSTRNDEPMPGVSAAGQASDLAAPLEVDPPESRFTEITSPAIAATPIQSAPSLGELSLFDSSRPPASGANCAIQASSVVMQANAPALSSPNESLAVKRAIIEGSETSTSASADAFNHGHWRSSAQTALEHGARQPSLPMQANGTFQPGPGVHNGLQHRHLSGPLPGRRSSSNSPTTAMAPPRGGQFSGYEPNSRTVCETRVSSRPGSSHSSPTANSLNGFALQQQTPKRRGSHQYAYDAQGNRCLYAGAGSSQVSPPLENHQDMSSTDLRQSPTTYFPASTTRQTWVPQQSGSFQYLPGYSHSGHQQAQQSLPPYQPAYPPPSALHGTPTYQHPHSQHHQQMQQLQPQNHQPYPYLYQQQQQSVWTAASAQPKQQQVYPPQHWAHAPIPHQSDAPQMMPQHQYASIPYYASTGHPPMTSGALPEAQRHVADPMLSRRHVQHAVQQPQAQMQRAQHILGQSQSYSMQQPQPPMQHQTHIQHSAQLSQQQSQPQQVTVLSTSTALTTVNSGQTTTRPVSTSLNTSNDNNSSPLDKLLATQEILEDMAQKSAETMDLNHVISQCHVLKRADLSDYDIDYFKRRAIVLMDQLKKKKTTA